MPDILFSNVPTDTQGLMQCGQCLGLGRSACRFGVNPLLQIDTHMFHSDHACVRFVGQNCRYGYLQLVQKVQKLVLTRLRIAIVKMFNKRIVQIGLFIDSESRQSLR